MFQIVVVADEMIFQLVLIPFRAGPERGGVGEEKVMGKQSVIWVLAENL